MAIGSGMSAQLGWAIEDVVGVAKAPTSFVPFISESLTQGIERVDSDAVEARRLLRSTDWAPGERTVGGDLGLELYTRGLGSLLLLMLGSVSTTQVAVDRWAHTYSPGTMTGRSATIQVGKPRNDAVVMPFTYAGCKVASWEVGLTAGEIATLGLTVAAMSETNDMPLGPPSYPLGLQAMISDRARLSLNGSPLGGIRSLKLAGDNALDTDRRPVTNSTTAIEPLEDGRRSLTGSLDGEFSGWHYSQFLAGAEATLTATLMDRAGETVVLSAAVRIDGETPTVGDRGVLGVSIPFTCVAPAGDASALTVTVTNNSPTP